MPVSILAVKCHHCGALVGRPKEAARTVTIEDLGGETIEHYAPSSNVMDALESFRADANSEKVVEKKKGGTMFGKKAPAPPKEKRDDGLPELDERSRALASIAMPRAAAPQKKNRGIAIGDYVRYIVIGAVVLLVGAGGVMYGPALFSSGEEADEFVSQVPALRQRGASNLEILRAAVAAVNHSPTPEHTADYEEAQEDLVSEVRDALNADTIAGDDLTSASQVVSQAAIAAPSSTAILDLKSEVTEEIQLYNATVAGVDSAKGQASFRYGGRTITVKKGEMLADRLRLDSIRGKEVRLTDTARGDRRIEAKLHDKLI